MIYKWKETNAKEKMRPLESDALILTRNERRRYLEARRVRKTKKRQKSSISTKVAAFSFGANSVVH